MPGLAQRLAGVWACAASLYLAAPAGPLLTIVQQDAIRSPRAPRTVDISADGRYIAFESRARLAPADTDDAADIYVLDRTSGQVTLESGDIGAAYESSHPRISGDGGRVVFEVRSGERLPRADIVLHDRVTSTVRWLTGDPTTESLMAWSRGPEISDNGNVIAFSSASTTLVPGPDRNGPREDIYVVDLTSGATRRVSLDANEVQSELGTSVVPSLSADGRWLAFASTAPLVAGVAVEAKRDAAIRHVYLRDLATGTMTLVSQPRRGSRLNGDSSLPSISGDGRFVAFASDASNILVAGNQEEDRNRGADVFLFDRDSGTVVRTSRGADAAAANGVSTNPVISADGRYLAFQSNASNLVCALKCPPQHQDINLLWDIFVFDRLTGTTSRISEDELGEWMEWSVGAAIDGSGRVVAFSSRHPIDQDDRLEDLDLFVRQLAPGALTRRAP